MTSSRIILLPGYVVSTDRTVKVIFCKGILDRGIKRVKTPQNDRNEPAGRPFRLVRITVVDQFPIRALSVQVGERAADKIVFSMAELTGDIWMMENISE